MLPIPFPHPFPSTVVADASGTFRAQVGGEAVSAEAFRVSDRGEYLGDGWATTDLSEYTYAVIEINDPEIGETTMFRVVYWEER